MKNFRKIIALFAVIFTVGIYLSVKTIKSSLKNKEVPQKTVEIQKDTLYLLKAEKKTV